jgi:DNA adenine methylase
MDNLFGGRTVDPVSPAAPYMGGKRNLARRVVRAIDAVKHDGYAEAFAGMGGIFFRRRNVPKVEIINDLSGDVSGFFRILQRHYVPFLEMLRYQITARREFERLGKVDPSTLTDLERAARFLYLQRTAYGGKVTGRSFGVDPADAGSFDMRRFGGMLEAVHERLAGVVIESLPYQDLIARYDRPGMLFYLDPPYYGCETDYGKDMFGRADFARLAEILGGLEGAFILSINDTPEVRRIFAAFDMEAVQTTYQVSGQQTPAAELIVRATGAG